MFPIAVDFDGTCVEHRYPDIGRPIPGAIKWLKEWVAQDAKIILFTVRCDSDKEGPVLTEAIKYLENNGVELWGVNQNPDQKWSNSPKPYARIYIDDAAFGCPLIHFDANGPYRRPYVDWSIVGPAVLERITSDK